MRLQMRCVDHDLLRLAAFARQFPEYFIEDSQPAPAYEPIIDGLVRAIFPRRVAPAQAVLDHKDDAALIRRSSTRAIPCESGKYCLIRRICASERRNKSDMAKPPRLAYESVNLTLRKKFNGS